MQKYKSNPDQLLNARIIVNNAVSALTEE